MSGFSKQKDFDTLLEDIWNRPLLDRYRLLKMSANTGYITDGYMISKMSVKEVDQINKLHKKALKGSDSYKDVEPFDLVKVLPSKLGNSVEHISYAGKGSQYNLVLVAGGQGLEVLVEALACSTLLKRHPVAQWYFSYGRKYFQKPIVLLEGNSLFNGKLLGAISPVQIKDSVHSGKSVAYPGDCCKVLSVKGKNLRYIQEGKDGDF